ncbi:MAG: hypothetical protein ABSB89_00800 [Candidatus Bathyarchaeia archaeon]
MLEIDRILELLATDRDWHSISELAEKTDLRMKDAEEITEFLAAHKFISLNDQGKRAKIERTVSLFLTRIQTEEKLSAR